MNKCPHCWRAEVLIDREPITYESRLYFLADCPECKEQSFLPYFRGERAIRIYGTEEPLKRPLPYLWRYGQMFEVNEPIIFQTKNSVFNLKKGDMLKYVGCTMRDNYRVRFFEFDGIKGTPARLSEEKLNYIPETVS